MATPAVRKTRLGLGVKNPIAYKDREQRVDVIAGGMMSRDNTLMKRARTQGMQVAAGRGLQNSSLAAGAAEAAVLDQVVPMASQTAQQNYGRNLSNQEYRESRGLAAQKEGIDGRLMDRDFAGRSGLSNQDYEQSRGLASQGFGFQKDLNKQEFGFQSDLSEQQYGQQKGLAAQAYKFDVGKMKLGAKIDASGRKQTFGFQKELTAIEAGFQESATRLKAKLDSAAASKAMTADNRRGAESQVSNIFNDYQNSVASILSNPNLPAVERNKLLTNAKDLVERRMDMTADIYGGAFDWPDGAFGIGTGAATAPAGSSGSGSKGSATRTAGNSRSVAEYRGKSKAQRRAEAVRR